MKKVWIFGDSFAEKYKESKELISWPTELQKTYNLTNFASGGCSPDTQIKKCSILLILQHYYNLEKK